MVFVNMSGRFSPPNHSANALLAFQNIFPNSLDLQQHTGRDKADTKLVAVQTSLFQLKTMTILAFFFRIVPRLRARYGQLCIEAPKRGCFHFMMEVSSRTCTHHQCFFFSRNIGQLTLKTIYFYYLKKLFLDQSIQKSFYLILKKEALRITPLHRVLTQWDVRSRCMCSTVLLFKPKYRLGHPENYLFLLSKKIFSGSKHPKNKLFDFENRSTGAVAREQCCVCAHLILIKRVLTL